MPKRPRPSLHRGYNGRESEAIFLRPGNLALRTPVISDVDARADSPRLMLLAAASLSLAFGAALLGPICQSLSETTAIYQLGDTAVLILMLVSSVLGLSAALAGAAPAVLAQGHLLFRCALVGAHLLLAWSVQVGGYLAFLSIDAESAAELCGSSLLGLLGMFAGLSVGLLVFGALTGWLLIGPAGDPKRPTFSMRGMMIATAVAALLFVSPRIVAPVVTEGVNRVYGYFDLHSGHRATVVSTDASFDGIPVMSLVFGVALASMMASAMLLRRSRWGWLGLSIGAIVIGTLAFVASAMSGTWTNPVGITIATAVSLVVGALQATLQTTLWEATGWRLVRIRRAKPNGYR